VTVLARILIAEDDKSINTLIRKNLELVGHICISVFELSGGYTVDISNLEFAVTDDTGREALVLFPVLFATENEVRGHFRISTEHNDFVPGWTFDGPPGIG